MLSDKRLAEMRDTLECSKTMPGEHGLTLGEQYMLMREVDRLRVERDELRVLVLSLADPINVMTPRTYKLYECPYCGPMPFVDERPQKGAGWAHAPSCPLHRVYSHRWAFPGGSDDWTFTRPPIVERWDWDTESEGGTDDE